MSIILVIIIFLFFGPTIIKESANKERQINWGKLIVDFSRKLQEVLNMINLALGLPQFKVSSYLTPLLYD